MSENEPPLAWLEAADGTHFPLVETCSIGRANDSHVVIADGNASRKHAVIQAQEGEYWLIDFGSRNGTFLNGRRVGFPQKLHSGDKIEITGRLFIFQRSSGAGSLEGASETAPTVVKVTHDACWLLLADLVNSIQRIRETPPAEWAMVLERWLAACREVVERSGGRIDKHVGDGFLAFWRVHEIVPAKVTEMLAGFRKLQAESDIRFRVILHQGSVACGAAPTPGEELMPCEDLNFIFRLEKFAARHGIDFCLSAAAQPDLAEFARIELVPGDHEIPGIDGPHAIFQMI